MTVTYVATHLSPINRRLCPEPRHPQLHKNVEVGTSEVGRVLNVCPSGPSRHSLLATPHALDALDRARCVDPELDHLSAYTQPRGRVFDVSPVAPSDGDG